jgi:hypothetical protein
MVTVVTHETFCSIFALCNFLPIKEYHTDNMVPWTRKSLYLHKTVNEGNKTHTYKERKKQETQDKLQLACCPNDFAPQQTSELQINKILHFVTTESTKSVLFKWFRFLLYVC